MDSADLSSLITSSKGYVRAIHTWLKGSRFPAKSKLAAVQMMVALEHHQAIVLLVPNHRVSSAAALLRPQYESVVRSIWVSRCCEQSMKQSIVEDDKYPLAIGKMIEQLESAAPVIGSLLRKYHEMNWSSFNSLTHGGQLQLMRHFSSEAPEPAFDRDAAQVLALSNGLTHNGLIELSVLARNMQIAEKSRQYYSAHLVRYEGK
jgi:hypothetical protein